MIYLVYITCDYNLIDIKKYMCNVYIKRVVVLWVTTIRHFIHFTPIMPLILNSKFENLSVLTEPVVYHLVAWMITSLITVISGFEF